VGVKNPKRVNTSFKNTTLFKNSPLKKGGGPPSTKFQNLPVHITTFFIIENISSPYGYLNTKISPKYISTGRAGGINPAIVDLDMECTQHNFFFFLYFLFIYFCGH